MAVQVSLPSDALAAVIVMDNRPTAYSGLTRPKKCVLHKSASKYIVNTAFGSETLLSSHLFQADEFSLLLANGAR